MWVKICATTNLPDALQATACGADAIGFVFAPSKRQVNAQQVAEITAHLPPQVQPVGVFGTVDAEEIVQDVCAAGLRGVQVHRAYDPGLIETLHAAFAALPAPVGLIQVLAVEAGDHTSAGSREGTLQNLPARLERALSDARLQGVLLDAASGGASGGLGVSFAWAEVGPMLQRAIAVADREHRERGTRRPRLLLAGGLRPENLQEAIRVLRPEGVDVASGVEASAGRKDSARVAAFVRAAREAATLTKA